MLRPLKQYIRLADWWSTTGSMYEGNRPPGYPYVSNQAVFLFIGKLLMPPFGGRKERRRKPAVFSWELDLRPIPH